MIPFVTFPTHHAPPPLQAAPIAGVPTGTGDVRLPAYAVPANTEILALPQQMRGGGVARFPAASKAAEGDAAAEPHGSVQPGQPAPVRLYTPFFAQLLAQASGPGEAEALVSLYANDNIPASTLSTNLMEVFSLVKYKPSYASMPPPEPFDAPPPATETVPARAAAPFMQAPAEPVAAEPPRAGAEARAAATQATVIATASVAAADAPPAFPAARGREAPERSSFMFQRPVSMLRPTGVAAYLASFARVFQQPAGRPAGLALG